MNKYFATISCGNGMTTRMLLEAADESKAESEARDECIAWASSFGYYQDYDYFGDNDQLAKEDSFCDEEEEYTDVSELEYCVVEYNPEEHDGYLN